MQIIIIKIIIIIIIIIMAIVPVVIGALGVVKKGIKKHNDKNYQKKLTSQNCKRSPS